MGISFPGSGSNFASWLLFEQILPDFLSLSFAQLCYGVTPADHKDADRSPVPFPGCLAKGTSGLTGSEGKQVSFVVTDTAGQVQIKSTVVFCTHIGRPKAMPCVPRSQSCHCRPTQLVLLRLHLRHVKVSCPCCGFPVQCRGLGRGWL